MIRLIAFLGNPGKEYERTRHNAGWLVADELSFASELVWKEKFKGIVASRGGLILLRPRAFMNRSGESVGPCASFYRVAPEELLVVHDDIELSFGRFELRKGGGLGGHNGLKDIVRVLGTREFERLRIGISRPQHGAPARHVLSRFSPDEEAMLSELLTKAARLLESRMQG